MVITFLPHVYYKDYLIIIITIIINITFIITIIAIRAHWANRTASSLSLY